MIRIALEVGLNVEGPRGIDAYFRGLIQGLARVDHRNQYLLFSYFYRDFEAKLKKLPIPHQENFKPCIKRWPETALKKFEWEWNIPISDWFFAKPERVTICHGLGGRLPRLSRAKTVVTIHDLIPEVFHKRALESSRDPELIPSGTTGI